MRKSLMLLAGLSLFIAAAAAPSQAATGTTWTHTTATLSQARYLMGSTSLGDLAFFGGGSPDGGATSVRTVDVYNASTGTWSTTQLSQGHENLGAASAGGYALFAGGDSTWYPKTLTNLVDIYRASTGQWSTAALSQPRMYVRATSVANYAIFAGGEAAGGGSTSAVDIFNGATGVWSTAALSQARFHGAMTSVAQYAIYGGGFGSSRVDIFNANTGAWSATSLSESRYLLAATSVGDYALFGGGHANSGGYSSTVDIFNAATGTWSVSHLSQARDWLAAGTAGNYAFFAGGTTSASAGSNVVDIFDSTTGLWATTTLSQARGILSATSVDGKVIFAGGWNNGSFSNAVDIFTPEPATLSLLALGGAAALIRRRRKGLAVVMVFLTIAGAAAAPSQAATGTSWTGTLKAVADCRIITWGPSYTDLNSNGGTPAQVSVFTAGSNMQRSLIRFDLSSLPADSSVQSATLKLYSRFEDGKGNYSGATMSVYRLAQPWVETEVTWNDRDWGSNHVNDSPGPGDDHPWATPGGDFVGTTGVTQTNPYATSNAKPSGDYVPVTWDVTNLVSEWYSGQSVNNGLMLMSGDYNNLCFWSREHNDGTHGIGYWAPALEVTLTPEPATLSLLALGGAAALIRRRRKGLAVAVVFLTIAGAAAAPAQAATGTTWTHTTANLSVGRDELAATTVGNYAIFGGGWVYPSGVKANVDIFDAGTRQWSTASLSVARSQLAATSVGNNALFGGGYDYFASSAKKTVDIFNASTGQWSTSSLSVARCGLAATTVGDYALFGGGTLNDSFSNGSSTVDIYNNGTGLWSTAALSQARAYLAATSVGGYALFGGGVNNGTSYSNRVDIFNGATGVWSTSSLSQGRWGLAATTLGNYAFFGGGHGSSGYSNVVDIFNASTGQWSTAALSQPRELLSATSVGNYAIFAGGDFTTSGLWSTNTVDIFDVVTGQWSTTTLSQTKVYLAATTVGNDAIFGGGEYRIGLTDTFVTSVDIFSTPEPATLSLLALGGAAALIRRRKTGTLAFCKRAIRKTASAKTGLVALALIFAVAGTAAAAPTATLVGTYNSSSWGVWLLGISAGDNDGAASIAFKVSGTTSTNHSVSPKSDCYVGDSSGVVAGTFGFSLQQVTYYSSEGAYEFYSNMNSIEVQNNTPYVLRHMGQQVIGYNVTNDDGSTTLKHIPTSAANTLTVPVNTMGITPGNYPNSIKLAMGGVQPGHVPAFVAYPPGIAGVNYIGLGENQTHAMPYENITAVFIPVPEPATLSLLALGGAAALIRRRKRSSKFKVQSSR